MLLVCLLQVTAWHCLEPVSFDLSSADSLREKAHKWLGQLLSVKEAKEPFKVYLLLGEPQNENLRPAFDKAVSILCTGCRWIAKSYAKSVRESFPINSPAKLKSTKKMLSRLPFARQPAVDALPILLNGHGLIHADGFHFLMDATRPNDFNFIRLGCLSQTDGDGQFGLREVAARRHDLA